MTHSNSVVSSTRTTAEPRQLLLVALCSLALVLAAFATPPAAQASSPPDVPLLSLFDDQSGENGDCVVTLSEDPVPGNDVTVTVRQRAQPVEDVRVWFDDRSVGVTNRSGQVVGEVPYVRTLEISVALPGGGSCEFVSDTANRTGNRPPEATDSRIAPANPMAVATTSGIDRRPAAQSSPEGNVTGTYPVREAIDIRVAGRPDPGENVTVVATVGSDPVPEATVSVDGREVGTTDANGRYELRIPDDGTSRLDVAVERGELRSEHTIDVRLLTVALRGANQFPLPGQTATAEATIGSDAVEGAVVTLDGERVGSTNGLGRAEFVLPADPTATVTVATGDRTATTPVSAAFAPTIVAVGGTLLVLLGVSLAVYWAGGRRGLAVLAGLAANLVTGVAGYVVAGRKGAVLATLSTLLVLGFVLVVFRPAAVRETGRSARRRIDGMSPGRWMEGVVDRVAGVVLRITSNLEAFLDQSRASLARTLDRLRGHDLRSVAADSLTWLAALPAWFGSALVSVVSTPRWLLAWVRSGPTPDEATATDERGGERTARSPGPTIRELWREFARTVVPEHWPRRTPGEVSRRAIDDGFPRDSVDDLTTVFRDVEYGGESLSNDRFRRAKDAFDALDVRSDRADDGNAATGNVATGSGAGENGVGGDDDADHGDADSDDGGDGEVRHS